jgi:hypothetical protein
MLTQRWNGSSWQNSYQSSYTNDDNGNKTQVITQQWDGISAWNNYTRSTFTYNLSNKVLTEVYDNWSSGSWVPNAKEISSYDGSGYLINYLDQNWDGVSWNDSYRSVYSNNPDGTRSQTTDQSWDGNKWNNSQRVTYTYDTATGFSELSSDEADFTVYPNPASDFIRIKTDKSINGSDYYFADQSGKTILKGKINSESNSIDITSLANGIYFLHIGERRGFAFKVLKNHLK